MPWVDRAWIRGLFVLLIGTGFLSMAVAADPSPYNAFLGKWEGRWETHSSDGEMVYTTLTVISIDTEKGTAEVLYTSEGSANTNLRTPISKKRRGEFRDARTLDLGLEIYKFDNGVLRAMRIDYGPRWTAIMKKAE